MLFVSQVGKLQYACVLIISWGADGFECIIASTSKDPACILPIELTQEALDHTVNIIKMEYLHKKSPHGIKLPSHILTNMAWDGETGFTGYAILTVFSFPLFKLPFTALLMTPT